MEENNDNFLNDNLTQVELPKDLQVSVNNSNQESVLSTDNLDQTSNKRISWLWIIIGFFAVLLVGGTIYFFIGKADFNAGTVLFTFEPEGVDVKIDEKFSKKSVSSLTMKLKAGEHILQITKEGYLDLERNFNIVSGEDSEMNLVLSPIPTMQLLFNGLVDFPGLTKNGSIIGFLNSDNKFANVESDFNPEEELKTFFEGSFSGIQDVAWSSGEPSVIVKILGSSKFKNFYDNRDVKGRFVPLGERPTQGLPRDNGISTWLFRSPQQTAVGWQPILLNESIRDVAFAPDSSRIIYFYETSDGEKSLIVAHPDGSEWERLVTQVDASNPQLQWLNDDRYVLMLDDGNKPDKLFDMITKEFVDIMPERIANTKVEGSPDGSKILYFINVGEEKRLALWNIASNSREKVFETPATTFAWQTDEQIIISKTDNTLWYWNLDGKQRPVQFISEVGEIVPEQLFYSWLSEELFVIEESRILSLHT